MAAALSSNADKIIDAILIHVVNPVIGLLFGIAFLVFLFGVFKFVKGAGEPGERKTGGQHIFWGIIGMFIMLTAFGIFNIVFNTVNDASPVPEGFRPDTIYN